jgi:hypothetical protein
MARSASLKKQGLWSIETNPKIINEEFNFVNFQRKHMPVSRRNIDGHPFAGTNPSMWSYGM